MGECHRASRNCVCSNGRPVEALANLGTDIAHGESLCQASLVALVIGSRRLRPSNAISWQT